MNKLIAASLLAFAVAGSAPARADDDSGLTFGLRAAYGVPFGSAGDGTDLNELTSGAFPLQLDAGYRFDRHWSAGAYLGYGVAMLAGDAKSALAAQGATDIGGHALMRVGLQGTYTFLPEARIAPWVGLAAGYEWTRYASAKVNGQDTEIGVRGFEASLQIGGDYKVAPRFTVGPFASFHVGQFQSRMTFTDGSGETASGVNDKGLHEWLEFGLKGTFNL